MNWQVAPQAGPLFAAALIAAGVAGAVARRRAAPGRNALGILSAAAGWWSLTAGVELLVTDVFWSSVLTKASYVGIVIVPVAWMLFVLEYTGRRAWLTEKRLALLFAIPTVVLIVAFTNEPTGVHALFWRDVGIVTDASAEIPQSRYGPLYWLHAAYAYSLLAIGSYLLFELVVAADHLYRTQAATLLAAVLAPWSANVLYLTNVIRTPYDPTIIGIVVTCALLLVTVYRHRLLEVVPAARQLARTELLETLDDPIVVVDDHDRVIDLNPAAIDVFDVERRAVIGATIETVSPTLREWLDGDRPEKTITYAVENAERYYDVQVTRLSQRNGTASGTLLALRDVTERQRNRQQVSVLNRLLRHNLSNTVTTILGNAEYAIVNAENDEVRERLDVIEANAEAMMDKQEKLNRVLRTFERDYEDDGPIETLLTDVVDRMRSTYPAADIVVDRPDTDLIVEGHERLRIALEEVLRNGIEHTDAATPTVVVSATVRDGIARIAISDDGPGIPDHELDPVTDGRETALSHGSGVGLWLVSWILHSLDGSVEFETDAGGTTVTMRVPGRE